MPHLKQQQYEPAEHVFTEVLDLVRTLGDHPGEVQAQRGIGLCHQARGDLPRARAALAEALLLVSQPNLTYLETQVRQDIARLSEPAPAATPT